MILSGRSHRLFVLAVICGTLSHAPAVEASKGCVRSTVQAVVKGTVITSAGGRAIAVFIDLATGERSAREVGERIGDGVIVAIDSGQVLLRRAGRCERMRIGDRPPRDETPTAGLTLNEVERHADAAPVPGPEAVETRADDTDPDPIEDSADYQVSHEDLEALGLIDYDTGESLAPMIAGDSTNSSPTPGLHLGSDRPPEAAPPGLIEITRAVQTTD